MLFRTHHTSLLLTKLKKAAPLIIISGAVFFSVLPFLNTGSSAINGLYLAGISVGTLEYDEVQVLLLEEIARFSEARFAIHVEDGLFIEATPQEMGITFALDETLETAWQRGKSGTVLRKVYEQAHAAFIGIHIPLAVTIDEHTFANFVTTLLSPIHTPASNAYFVYNPRTDAFDFINAQKGLIINLDILKRALIHNAQMLAYEPLRMQRSTEEPLVRTHGADTALEAARDILAAMPYTIFVNDTNTWEIEKDDLVTWITFIPKFDEREGRYGLVATISLAAVTDYLTVFAPGLNTLPHDAEFILDEDGRVAEFTLSEPGRTLDVGSSAVAVQGAIMKGEPLALLSFHETQPQMSSESINDLGISALLGRGESNFVGSSKSRAHNISVGANKYQGILVAPGEEFSFNDLLGPVTAAEGYLPELVIKKDKTIPEYGGGLCQVSTTLFRAAVNSGLEITQRYNHSYPVVYYGTPGFDATIYPGGPDMHFRNTTGGHVLIQYKLDGTKLSFEIYGEDDGRTVELDGPYTYDEKPDGAVKARLTQTVRNKEGDVILEKTFYSNYRSPDNYPIERNPLE